MNASYDGQIIMVLIVRAIYTRLSFSRGDKSFKLSLKKKKKTFDILNFRVYEIARRGLHIARRINMNGWLQKYIQKNKRSRSFDEKYSPKTKSLGKEWEKHTPCCVYIICARGDRAKIYIVYISGASQFRLNNALSLSLSTTKL